MIKNNLFILTIFIIFFTILTDVFASDSILNKYNLQTLTTIQSTNGKAFGENTSRQILNNLSEIPLNKTSSVGEILQFSKVESSYKNNTQGYSFNGIEFFYRNRILATKFANITLHNSYRFHGIYNENKYLQQMPKQNDYEIKLLMTHNMTDRLINNLINPVNSYFMRLEIGYRHKFNNPFDEIRERLYLGLKLNSRFSFLVQHDLIFAITRNTSPTRNSKRQLQDFDFSKNFHHIILPSFIYKLNNQSAIQFAYLHRFGGNDRQYDSRGFLVGYLKSF